MHESNELLRICREVFPEVPDEEWEAETEEDWYWNCAVSMRPGDSGTDYRFFLRAEYEECFNYTSVNVSGLSPSKKSFELSATFEGEFDGDTIQEALQNFRRLMADDMF